MSTQVTVNLAFEAAHRLHNPERDDEWNRRVYGKCNNPNGHGHNYLLEVTVEGEVDPETGYLIDMSDLKEIIRRAVVNEVDHRHLNIDVPWLATTIPTAENLARVFYERISSEMPGAIHLTSVTVHETDRNRATYGLPVS
jgi:6-pyruvoyltetrahydropterin/6-carboxytetrahydropterin synthase